MSRLMALAAAVSLGAAALEAVLAASAHGVPGLAGAFGFIGCVAIVVVSKALGKAWLQRPERDDE